MSLDIFNRKWKSSLQKLFNSRDRLLKEDFYERMRLNGYNRSSIDIIYNGISNYLPLSVDINLYPNDDIINDYGIDDEDLGDILINYFKKLNVDFPSQQEQSSFYKEFGNTITVERMIHFVDFFGNGTE